MTLNDYVDLLFKLAILGIVAAAVGGCLLMLLLAVATAPV